MAQEYEFSQFEPDLFGLKFADPEMRKEVISVLHQLKSTEARYVLEGLKNLTVSPHGTFPDSFELKAGGFMRVAAKIADGLIYVSTNIIK